MTTRKLATKAKVRFIDLVRPDGWPLPIEVRFGVFRWMVETAQATEPTRGQWGTCGPCELLSLKPTCVNLYEVDPVVSAEDLARRFHYALLSGLGSRAAKAWRASNRIDVTETRWVYFPHRQGQARFGESTVPFCGALPWSATYVNAGRSEAQLRQQVDALLGSTGKLQVQLSGWHDDAVDVHGVVVHVAQHGFRFVLRYGVDGSRWYHDLASSFAGEAFIDTLDRACVEMERVAEWPEQYAGPAIDDLWPTLVEDADDVARLLELFGDANRQKPSLVHVSHRSRDPIAVFDLLRAGFCGLRGAGVQMPEIRIAADAGAQETDQ